MVNERSPELAWISGASPLTSTTSVVPPTSITSVTDRDAFAGADLHARRFSVLNEGIATSMV